MTQNFTLNYIKPVYITTNIVVEGVVGSNEVTHLIIQAHIKDMSDKILVESNSTWKLLDKQTLSNFFPYFYIKFSIKKNKKNLLDTQ